MWSVQLFGKEMRNGGTIQSPCEIWVMRGIKCIDRASNEQVLIKVKEGKTRKKKIN